jgi:peptidoglycan/LPS O-acetylase OafA/YrhL
MRSVIAAPIDDASLDGRNNFHLLRLVAALLVLFAHSYHLLGRAAEEPIGRWFARLDASLLGVAIFFVLSGFLVSRSWDRRRDMVDFLIARALRIAPALWALLFITVLVAGPAATTLAPAAYLSSPDTLAYLFFNLFLDTQYLLPGVFESNPVPGVNGSLWTIPLEVVLYIVLGICGWVGALASPLRPASIVSRIERNPVVAAALLLLAALLVSKILRTGQQYYGLAGYFVLGALCYRFRHALLLRLDLTLGLILVAVLGARTALEPIVVPLAIVATVLALALHPAFRMQPTWLHRHDYSYGAYLYGFPVQQSLIALGASDPWLLFGGATLVTLGCAALSWHLIERPCLDLKPRAFRVSTRIRLFRARSP